MYETVAGLQCQAVRASTCRTVCARACVSSGRHAKTHF